MSEQENQPPQDTSQILAERKQKLAALREQGNAFPNDFQREHLAADLHGEYGALTNGCLLYTSPSPRD